MVKHTQTICRVSPTNCLSVFDHFAGLGLKRLIISGVPSLRANSFWLFLCLLICLFNHTNLTVFKSLGIQKTSSQFENGCLEDI